MFYVFFSSFHDSEDGGGAFLSWQKFFLFVDVRFTKYRASIKPPRRVVSHMAWQWGVTPRRAPKAPSCVLWQEKKMELPPLVYNSLSDKNPLNPT